ncbi:hypothetical protein MUN82_09175 [Hymenobacter aerilatus]|uniref:Uncharacterized protein n=1 Tax=Hymenobacter aerilatus TaxID=2932251 RepID=A0A8T9T249_9BACT|nr:hypothetical protein [Hymenobacter aerilatus]UOR07254.1 hypothetical protein MUN82_09175 [Hymenobacter aerilatus]
MQAYLRLRLRVLRRHLLELGWWRILLLGAMLLAVTSKALLMAAHHTVGQWVVPIMGMWLCLSAHWQRNDLHFLQAVAPTFRQWLAAEYALLLSPAAVVLLAHGRVGAAVLVGLAAAAVPWLPIPAVRVRKRGRSSLFRAEAFEWVGGWRQGGGTVVWLGLLSVAVWQHQQPIVAAGAAVLWLFWVLSCYGTAEPSTMVLLVARGVGAFLRRRLWLLWAYYLLTAAPFLTVMAAGPATWVGALGMLLWSLTVLGNALLAKYAFYPNDFLSRTIQMGVVVLGLLIVLNTVYGALFVAAFPVLLNKSRRRLAAFRYD